MVLVCRCSEQHRPHVTVFFWLCFVFLAGDGGRSSGETNTTRNDNNECIIQLSWPTTDGDDSYKCVKSDYYYYFDYEYFFFSIALFGVLCVSFIKMKQVSNRI